MKTIDIHTHGIDGFDTRSGADDDILKIAEISGSYGISEIVLAIYPSSIEVMRENMMTIKKAMEKQDTGYMMQDIGFEAKKDQTSGIMHQASIIGVHLEGPFLNPTKCGALNGATFIEPTEHNFEKLIDGFEDIVKIITIAPEIRGALQLIKKASDRGIIVSMGHSDATFSEAEAGFNAGAKGITHIFNAMRGFHHREPGIAGFGLMNKDIYIEVIADPFHLHPETLNLIFEMKHHEKIIIVSDSVKATKTLPINQCVTDEQGRLQGGSMTIVESSKRLIQMGFDEDIVTRCITTNPERYLSR